MTSLKRLFYQMEPISGPLIITFCSAYIRILDIAVADKVVWDEAHFGKFGAYYNLREFYFDVHPPMGKLLIGLSEYMADFNGSFLFDSGSMYPDHVDYTKMRLFNAIFGILVSPIAYFTAKSLGFNLWTVYAISFMVTFENIFVVLSKFILLDSMLLFFTALTFLGLSQFHKVNQFDGNKITVKGINWLLFTGISIGCVCSVKWVGLFITSVVGIYTIFDLFFKFLDNSNPKKNYFKQWCIRIITLIVIPSMIYVLSFKIHFLVLNKAGTGHSSMPTLFQINLENTDIEPSPRNIAFGSKVTIRSHGLSPNLLHSHVQLYPEGSRQHQITTYGHKDSNNNWIFAPSRLNGGHKDDYLSQSIEYVRNGDRIRLVHERLGCNLHSHEVSAHITKNAFEASGYGNEEIGDSKDDWIIEIVEQIDSPTEPNITKNQTFNSLIHPISTNFRLRHAELGCYLATSGNSYPAWGFKQGEVICKSSFFTKDKSTWWNVEDHSHEKLTNDEEYFANPPKSNFWRDFILLNFAMQASNNALVPDSDKFDHLASKWWEWIFLKRGIRMSSWGLYDKKYYMLPNPFVLWFSSLSILITILNLMKKIYLWQVQEINYSKKASAEFWDYSIKCFTPFLAWIMHILPFIIMSRVTYVHHYVPAEFFAIFVAGYLIENTTSYIEKRLDKISKEKPNDQKSFISKVFTINSYLIIYILIIGTFYYFSPVSIGMEGSSNNYKYLQWLESWEI